MIIPHPIVPIPPAWPLPKLRLHIEDLDHEGVDIFLGAVNPKEAMQIAVQASYRWLYTQDNPPPGVTEILLVLRSMPGVAHTKGAGTDNTKKEIHFSLDYIVHTKNRAAHEITGVLVHEVVHCYQYDAKHTCPGGLIEGMADYVRLKADCAPPHWRRRGEGSKWDAGYDTTGYFLSWIEETFGPGTIPKLNWCMKDSAYHHKFFEVVTSFTVEDLWNIYCAVVKEDEDERKDQGVLSEHN